VGGPVSLISLRRIILPVLIFGRLTRSQWFHPRARNGGLGDSGSQNLSEGCAVRFVGQMRLDLVQSAPNPRAAMQFAQAEQWRA
jgi:hypothetical protein